MSNLQFSVTIGTNKLDQIYQDLYDVCGLYILVEFVKNETDTRAQLFKASLA